jgi:uridine phosphorylase
MISETDLILNQDGSVYHLNLLPDQIADTIITVGDPGRVYSISRYFDEVVFEMNRREFITHVGFINDKKVMVLSTGMGTGNIEIVLTELDALMNIDLTTRELKEKKRKLKIIRVGTSGALQEDIPLDSFLVSEYAAGFDNLMNFYNLPQDEFEKQIGEEIKEQTGIPSAPYIVNGSQKLLEKYVHDDFITGNTITCPGFYGPQGRKLRLDLKYPKLLDKLNQYHHDQFWLTNFEMETSGYYAFARLLGHHVLSINAIIANRMTNEFSKQPQKTIDKLIRCVLELI